MRGSFHREACWRGGGADVGSGRLVGKKEAKAERTPTTNAAFYRRVLRWANCRCQFASRRKGPLASQNDGHLRWADLPTSSVRTRILPPRPPLRTLHTSDRLLPQLHPRNSVRLKLNSRFARRKQYTVEELGPSRYLLHEQMCIRRDLEVPLLPCPPIPSSAALVRRKTQNGKGCMEAHANGPRLERQLMACCVWQLRNRMKMKLFCSHYLPVNTDSLKASHPPLILRSSTYPKLYPPHTSAELQCIRLVMHPQGSVPVRPRGGAQGFVPRSFRVRGRMCQRTARSPLDLFQPGTCFIRMVFGGEIFCT